MNYYRQELVTKRAAALRRQQKLDTIGEYAAAALIFLLPFAILFI